MVEETRHPQILPLRHDIELANGASYHKANSLLASKTNEPQSKNFPKFGMFCINWNGTYEAVYF